MLAEGLWNLMSITPEIAALVNSDGSPSIPSIHHGSLRKGYTLPAIRFSEVTSTPITTTDGTAAVRYTTYQFDCFAVKYLDARRLLDAVTSLLTDYKGTLAEGTVIRSSIPANVGRDNPLEEGKSGYVNRCTIDIRFAYDDTGLPVIVPPTPDVTLNIEIDDQGLWQEAGLGNPD